MGTSATHTAQNKARMLEALKITEGNVSTAVDKANVGRRQHYQWLKDDEAYKEAVSDINESLVDLSEVLLRRRGKSYEYTETSIEKDSKGEIVKTVITTKLMAENVDAIKAHLSAKVRERGYGTKIEVGGMKDAPPIEIGMVKIVTRNEKSTTEK